MICPKCGKTSACDKPSCPLKARELFARTADIRYKKDFSGTTPNVFVGHYGYPNVNVGLLSTDFSKDEVDDPKRWSKEGYDMNRIVNLRTALVNSRFTSPVTAPRSSTRDKLRDISKEVSLSPKKIDTEIHLKRAPSPSLSFNSEATPHGPSAPVKDAEVTENVKVPTKVDKVVSDDDLKAGPALNELYRKHFDEHYLTKILSMGNLGVSTQRKIVPTRWSITAVDDTLGKRIMDEIQQHSGTLGPQAFYGGYMENYFLALFFPGRWSFDFIENYAFDMESDEPAASVKHDMDSEGPGGRKSYASSTAGAYYAARLALLEYLKAERRQASIVLLRFTTTEYYASLGVWVVREAVRKTLETKPIEFGSESLMLEYAKKLAMRRFRYDLTPLLKKSTIIDARQRQRSLRDF